MEAECTCKAAINQVNTVLYSGEKFEKYNSGVKSSIRIKR